MSKILRADAVDALAREGLEVFARRESRTSDSSEISAPDKDVCKGRCHEHPPRSGDQRSDAGRKLPYGREGCVMRRFQSAQDENSPVKDVTSTQGPDLVHDPLCRIRDAAGRESHVLMKRGDWWFFFIPPHSSKLTLYSRLACVLTDGCALHSRDQRFGVFIGGIRLISDGEEYTLSDHLTENSISGWRPYERGAGGRWTEGCAEITVPKTSSDERQLLAIQIDVNGLYWRGELPVTCF